MNKQYRVFYFIISNPDEMSMRVEALTLDFAREDVSQQLSKIYGRHGYRITRVELIPESLAC